MSLATMRQEIADALNGAGIQARPFLGEVIDPPIALVGPGSPYVEDPDKKTFKVGTFKVRLEITLVAATAVNEETTAQLDSLIEDVLRVCCVEQDWNLEGIQEPGTLPGSGWLATNITITNKLEVNE